MRDNKSLSPLISRSIKLLLLKWTIYFNKRWTWNPISFPLQHANQLYHNADGSIRSNESAIYLYQQDRHIDIAEGFQFLTFLELSFLDWIEIFLFYFSEVIVKFKAAHETSTVCNNEATCQLDRPRLVGTIFNRLKRSLKYFKQAWYTDTLVDLNIRFRTLFFRNAYIRPIFEIWDFGSKIFKNVKPCIMYTLPFTVFFFRYMISGEKSVKCN